MVEVKEGRAVMYKTSDDSRASYIVHFNINRINYSIPMYANVGRNESIYYGGNVIKENEHE